MYDLEAYFTGLGTDDIRLHGHRIGIDNVLAYHLAGKTASQIQALLPSLRLDEIYATLTYYYANQADVDAYLARLTQWRDERYAAWVSDPNPSPALIRIRALEAQRQGQA